MARIAIVGAGAAGISAARPLATAGHDVSVWEARAQAGGRALTDTSFTSHPVELGAEFVHGERVATWDWIRTLGARTTDAAHRYEMWFHLNGSLQDRERATREFGTDPLGAIEQLTRRWLDSGRPDTSLDHVLNLWPEISREPLTEERRRLIDNYVSELTASDPRDLGVYRARRRSAEPPETRRHFRLIDGYSDLVSRAAAGLSITVERPVTSVRWDDRSAEVCAGDRVERVDRVIVTVPLGVLRRGDIEFIPELPEPKRNAIHKLNTGHISKVILRFDHVYWPPNMTFLWTPLSTQVWWRPGQGQPDESPVLTAFFGGQAAADLESASEAEVVAEAARQLGDILRQPLSGHVLDGRYIAWGREPHIWMGYSSAPPNGDGLRDALAAPAGALYFAGEATNASHPATVHGAIESGTRAAAEVLDSLNAPL
jgi:monoamine oxidase